MNKDSLRSKTSVKCIDRIWLGVKVNQELKEPHEVCITVIKSLLRNLRYKTIVISLVYEVIGCSIFQSRSICYDVCMSCILTVRMRT